MSFEMAEDEAQDLSHEDLDIIDLDTLDINKDDETWLVSSPIFNHHPETKSSFEDWLSKDLEASELAPPSKKSLVRKLDMISKGSPTHLGSSSSSSFGASPSFISRHNMSSTPISKLAGTSGQSGYFDSRTFSRAIGVRPMLNQTFDLSDDDLITSSPIKLHQTASSSSYYKLSSPHLTAGNSTYDRDGLQGLGLQMLETYDRKSYFRLSSPKVINSTFSKETSPVGPQLNSTFNKDELRMAGGASANVTYNRDLLNQTETLQTAPNSTFEIPSQNTRPNATFEIPKQDSLLHATFDVNNQSNGHNATFEVQPNFHDSSSVQQRARKSSNGHFEHLLSREQSHDLLDEDRLSTTSESSVSHRLNDVGDVQNIARLQEESLRHPIPSSHRSATISPSSEHSANSPSTEGYMTGNNLGYCSEEGGIEATATGSAHHYSSQDSLPDSPYSSQSLDVQPLSEQDRLRRSMPNLNKIRAGRGSASGLPMSHGGHGSHAMAANAHHAASANQRPMYGALSRQHNSDPRLIQAGTSRLRYQAPQPPSRGTIVPSRNEVSNVPRIGGGIPQTRLQYGGGYGAPAMNQGQNQGWGNTLVMPKVSTSTGIPRPGSRIPGPKSGIPKPGGYSQPSSRSSSIGPRKLSSDNYY